MNQEINKTIRERFFANLHNDWALPGLVKQVHENAQRQTPAPSIDMDIALIGGVRLNAALGDVLRVTRLSFSEWRAQLEKLSPAFLLVESDWLEADDPWRNALIGSASASSFKEITDYCRESGMPTAFWFHRDAQHLDAFKNVMHLFDYVFANEMILGQVERIRKGATPLKNYVDIGCYNPYKQKSGDWSALSQTIPLLMARAYDYMQASGGNNLSEHIAALFEQNFWLYEDRYNIRNNNQRMSPIERCRVLGCFHDEQRAALLKPAIAEILPEAVFPDASPQVERHILECLATKTLCISDSNYWASQSGAGLRRVESAAAFHEEVADLLCHPVDAAISAHQGWRHVMEKATYFEFVERICSVMGVPFTYSVPKNARLSFILPTIRPDLVPMSIELYQSQTYINRELVIVLNMNDVDTHDIERAIGDDDSIKLLQTPADMPVGCAVNFGVMHMTGDYWAKMDDDDYYSPNYLSDINLYRKCVDFDIAGKGALFNYLEADDRTVIRSWPQADRESHNFAGGTLVVKNTPENVHWPEKVRGYADIEFLTKRLVEGAHIASLDPFSHIQIRRRDSRFHTWTRQSVHANSAYESQGLNIESVFV